MSTLIQAFDPIQFDPSQSAGILPVGRHPVVIEHDEVKANKNNDGGYLQFNLRVIDGPQTGATGPYRLNLYHSNKMTSEIAHRQLSALCHVLGVFRLGPNGNDTSVLHNLPFIVEVCPQKNNETYTEVKRVYDINGKEPRRGKPQPQPQDQAQPQPQPQPQPQVAAWAEPQPAQPAQPAPAAAPAAWAESQPAPSAPASTPATPAAPAAWQQAQGTASPPWASK